MSQLPPQVPVRRLSDEDILLEDGEFVQLSQSISSMRCIVEEGDEDLEETERGEDPINDDEHSEIDSDSEENPPNDNNIVEDNEIDDSDKEEEESNDEIFDSDEEDNDQREIDSDDEYDELIESTQFRTALDIVRELDSEDSSEDFKPEKLVDDNETASPSQTTSLYYSNDEYSFYNSDDGTRSNSHSTMFLSQDTDINTRSHSHSHSTAFHSQDTDINTRSPSQSSAFHSQDTDINTRSMSLSQDLENKSRSRSMSSTVVSEQDLEDLKPTVEPLKTGVSDRPTIQPLKGGTDGSSSFRNDKSPPRRHVRRNRGLSSSDHSAGFSTSRSERGRRTFGMLKQDDFSRSERGLRTFHDTSSTTSVTPTVEKLRGASPPRNQEASANFQAETSPPRHHLKRYDLMKGEGSQRGIGAEHDLSNSERSLRSIEAPPVHQEEEEVAASMNKSNSNKRGLWAVQSERGFRTVGTDRSQRGLRTIGTIGADMSRSERGLRTIGADMSRSERGLRTFGDGADMNRSKLLMRSIGSDMSRSERGMRTFGGTDRTSQSERGVRSIAISGGPRRGPRRRHLMATGKLGRNSIGSSSSSSFLRASGSSQYSSAREGGGNNYQHQGETGDEGESSKETDKSTLNLLASINDTPFQDDEKEEDDPPQNDVPLEQVALIQPQDESGYITPGQDDDENDWPHDDVPSEKLTAIQPQDESGYTTPAQDDDENDAPYNDLPSEQYPGPSSSPGSCSRPTNYLEILQSKIPNTIRAHGPQSPRQPKAAFKSVAARLFAERNKMYSSCASSKEVETSGVPSVASSLFLEPSSSLPHFEKQELLPEDEVVQNGGANKILMTAGKAPNESTATPSAGATKELLQDYRILADRLKSLIASVQIYHQANQELKIAREQFLEDCDVLCGDAAQEMQKACKMHDPSIAYYSTHDTYEMDQTWRSRARIRQWFANIRLQQPLQNAPSEGLKEAPSSTQVGMHEEDMVLQQQEILDYIIEWEDIVGNDVEQQIQILKKLQNEKDHYDRKVKRLQSRMKLHQVTWGRSKLERNLNKQSTATQNYESKEGEVAFLLNQVTQFGWKDLYPLVEATLFEEWRRLNEEQHSSFGAYLPVAIEEIERVQAQEAKIEESRLSGISSKTLSCPIAVVDGEHGNWNANEGVDEELFDASKPLIVVDSRSPHGFVAWMAMLEHEHDPYNPALFDFQLISCENSETNSPTREKKDMVDAFRLWEQYELETNTPLLIHKGTVLFGTLCLAEYIDRFWKDELPTGAFHELVSVIPHNALEEYNMNEFLQQHSVMESLWDEILKSWLESKGEPNAQARQKLEVQVQRFIMNIEEVDLAKFAGPFLCGHRFTLADIHLFAYWEHMLLLLTMMKMLVISDSSTQHEWVFGGSKLQRFSTWFDKVSSRPSALAMASITDSSFMNIQEGGPTTNEREQIMKHRRDYLVEHYRSVSTQ